MPLQTSPPPPPPPAQEVSAYGAEEEREEVKDNDLSVATPETGQERGLSVPVFQQNLTGELRSNDPTNVLSLPAV